MTNEEFQHVLLNELKELRRDSNERFDKVEQRLDKVERKLDVVFEQTAGLIEFRAEVTQKLNSYS